MVKEMNTLEKMGSIFNKYSIFNEQIVVRCTGVFDEELFKQTLRKVQKKHYYLNCSIDYENFLFKEFDTPIDIPLIVKFCSDFDDLDTIATNLINTPLNCKDTPSIRIYVLSCNTQHAIIFTINHIISDGISGLSLINDIFSIYDAKEITTDTVPIATISLEHFPSSIDDDFSIFDFKEYKTLINDTLNISDRKNCLTVFDIKSRTFNKLVSYCKENNLNVYSTFTVLASIALSEIIYYNFPKSETKPPVFVKRVVV